MLGKLLKHEFAAMSRVFVPLFAVVLAIAALTGLAGLILPGAFSFDHLETSPFFYLLITPVLIIGNMAAIGAALVVPFIAIVIRFYRSFLGPEGYLMFTLPVTRHQLILSKLISGLVWQIASIVIAIVASGIAVAGWIPFWGVESWLLQDVFAGIFSSFEHGGSFLLLSLISVPISIASGILMAYLSMSLGQLANSARIALSFVAYIGLWIGISIVSYIIALPIEVLTMSGSNITAATLYQTSIISMIMANLISLAVCAAMYFGTEYLLNKRLNLL